MVKLADTLGALGDFPVAMANGVNITKADSTEKSLQDMYDDGELGGSGSVDDAFSETSENAVQNRVITKAMGSANGFATLDENGKLISSQLPTSSRKIVSYLDASADHTLPDETDYEPGNEIIITVSGYILQSTAFTLKAGKTLTNLEVVQANTLIENSYVFTLSNASGTSLGTVKTFALDKVTLSDDTEVSLPYAEDLSATSTPAVVQVSVTEGDSFLLIDNHWIHLTNTSSVTSVNGKSGSVVLSVSDISGSLGSSDIATTWEDTPVDTKVPSEKLVKAELNEKLNMENPSGEGSISMNRQSGTSVGVDSVALGHNCSAVMSSSVALGYNNYAGGFGSFAEGENTVALGGGSHSEGIATYASTTGQHVEGKFNVVDEEGVYAHIIGGGTSDTDKKNIHTVDWNGNAVYAGDVSVTKSDGTLVSMLDMKTAIDNTETWIFTLTGGTTVTKKVVIS